MSIEGLCRTVDSSNEDQGRLGLDGDKGKFSSLDDIKWWEQLLGKELIRNEVAHLGRCIVNGQSGKGWKLGN